MWVGSITRSELPSPLGRETTLSVTASAREAAGACSEDSAFAGLEGAGRDEEDELKLLKCAHDGKY